MSTSTGIEAAGAAAGFSRVLRDWRRRRRLSQLELSLVSGVTQRHLSFLESGRSKPSRHMVFQLSEALEVPLRERNAWLLAAGYAPAFRERELAHPEMAQVTAAVRMMLDNHEPYPALAVDRAWNLRLTNAAFDALVALLGDDAWERVGGAQRNLVRLIFHPAGVRPLVTNWSSIAPAMWHRLRREAEAGGAGELQALLDELAPLQDDGALRQGEGLPLLPVLPLELERDGARLSVFTVIATFGTAQDVTADELRIETFFPADAETDAAFRALAGSAAGADEGAGTGAAARGLR